MKKILLLLLLIILSSCNRPSINQARQVKIGINTNELKYLMGEPYDIEFDSNGEKWYFVYRVDCHDDYMRVNVVNDRVTDFISY